MTAQDYEVWTRPLRRHPSLTKALLCINKVLTLLVYLAYPLLLLTLLLQKDARLATVFLTPAISSRGPVVDLPGEPGPSLEYRREFPLPWRVVHDRHEQGRSRRQGNPRCHHQGGKGRGGIHYLEEASP